MGAGKIISKIALGTLAFISVAGGVAMAVPQSREKIANDMAVNFSTDYKNLLTELENQKNEYKVTSRDITYVHFTKASDPVSESTYTDIALGNISFNKALIESDFVNVNIVRVNKGAWLDVSLDDKVVSNVSYQKEAYELAEDFEYIHEIYDGAGRKVELIELDDESWYTFGVTYNSELAKDGTLTKLICRIDLQDIITPEEEVTLKSGKYICTNDEVLDYFVVDSENGTVDYYYCGETLSTGTFSLENGNLKMVITESEIDCSLVENGFIFGEETFVFQENIQE